MVQQSVAALESLHPAQLEDLIRLWGDFCRSSSVLGTETYPSLLWAMVSGMTMIARTKEDFKKVEEMEFLYLLLRTKYSFKFM